MRDLFTDPLCGAADVGKPIPDSLHAISVALPLWKHVVGYEEGDPEVISQFEAGYPRFFIHPLVRLLFDRTAEEFARNGETALVFPSLAAAWRCAEFVKIRTDADCRLESIGWDALTAVIIPESANQAAMKCWQHGGEVVSSRLADAALSGEETDPAILDAGDSARAAIRDRIARIKGQSPEDVFLFSSGMAAIFAVHRALGKIHPDRRSVQVEFPYVDALKVQQQFGPGAIDLSVCEKGGGAEVQGIIDGGESIAGVYTELPSNPLLRTADLAGLAKLLQGHGAPLIIDDTVATAANVDAFRFADVVTTSLTKIFSGVGDVMAGAVILRSGSPFHEAFHAALSADRCDAPLFAEDAIALEANSRDFVERVHRINAHAEILFDYLAGHPMIERIWYPKTESPENYRAALRSDGGYGGLMSVLLRNAAAATPGFYDALRISKGPSLGTNFSLACPYTLLAHYQELDWAESCGVDRNLIRIWTGLEDPDDVIGRFEEALGAS